MNRITLMVGFLLCGVAGMAVVLKCYGLKFFSPRASVYENAQAESSSDYGLQNQAVQAISQEKAFEILKQTPIEFYGKVVDQHGAPIADAKVSLAVQDKLYSATKMTVNSDVAGKFHVKGAKGSSLGVSVTKTGYLELPHSERAKPTSSKIIDYALLEDKGARYKDPNKPMIFTLHRLGTMEPLVYFENQRWRLPVDGTPRMIALDTQKGIGPHQIEFRFNSAWTRIPKDSDDLFKMFDWKVEMRVPGGGIFRRENDYVFEAPESGYEERIIIDYPKNSFEWKKFLRRNYFLRFSDNTHARIEFDISADSDPESGPLRMTSWLNLKPGSRNLASDK